ncbi:MAG TPA: DUF2934 domain-containing protein [Stellaceae bacterium]|nr:DUF2934 domain-containing protein [Stellaceae bacterium]
MESASREQRIRERAYAIWEGEGRPAGRADAHWLQAEAEIAGEAAQPNGRTVRAAKRSATPAKKKWDRAGASAAPARRRTKA